METGVESHMASAAAPLHTKFTSPLLRYYWVQHPWLNYRVVACPNSVAPRLAVEDGWKGEEGESSKGEEGEGESGETRQSHEEHMRTLAGMALSHPSNGSSIRPEPRVVSCSHLSSPFKSLCSHLLFFLCSHSKQKKSRVVICCLFPQWWNWAQLGWSKEEAQARLDIIISSHELQKQ